MPIRVWLCNTCRKHNSTRDDIWECPGCGEETCERCFCLYAHCKPCAKGKDEEDLRMTANLAGWDFEPLD